MYDREQIEGWQRWLKLDRRRRGWRWGLLTAQAVAGLTVIIWLLI